MRNVRTFNFEIKSSIPWTGHEPPVQFEQAFAGSATPGPELLSQHCLITGQTGAGKTLSYLLPFARATLRYTGVEGRLPAGLVIDPKSELLPHLQRAADLAPRLRRLGEAGKRLRYFEFTPRDLSCWERAKALLALPAANTQANGNVDHWVQMGAALACDLMQLQAQVWRASSSQGEKPVNFLAQGIQSLRQMMTHPCGKRDRTIAECLAQADAERPAPTVRPIKPFDAAGKSSWRLLREYLGLVVLRHEHLVQASERIDKLLEQHGLDEHNPLNSFTSDPDLIKQFMYLCMSIQPQLATLSSPDLERFLDLDPTGTDVQDGNPFSMRDSMDAGDILVYQPGSIEPQIDQFAGMAIKQMLVRHIQSRSDLEQPIVYVCDEFHRYVSRDPHFGEPVFLSFCRSYRVMACLCTQSISAIELALSAQKGAASARAARDAILANCATKILMRSTDSETQKTAVATYPFATSGERPHVIEARPLATLKVGESYFMTADARFGREQVQFDKDALQIDRRPAPVDERALRKSIAPSA